MRSRPFLFSAFLAAVAIAQPACFLVSNDDDVASSNDSDAGDAGSQDAAIDRSVFVDADKPALPGVVLFAGDGPQFFQDTWQFDGALWNEDTPATTSPPVRYGHRLAALNGKVILFGGQGLSGYLDDTWSWDGKAWTQLNAPGPHARANQGMTTYNGKILMYGGDGDTADVGTETWEFDGTSWTQLDLTGANPGNCIGPAMTTLGDSLVLYGG
ncbi:MAG: Kelch repeat-containing protein, partial [Polyangiaceae bacterium]